MTTDQITLQAKRWKNERLPTDLMSSLVEICEDDWYSPEKRVHRIVWEALMWMRDNPIED